MSFRNDKTQIHPWKTIQSKYFGSLVVIFWVDNRHVQLLSTIHHMNGHWGRVHALLNELYNRSQCAPSIWRLHAQGICDATLHWWLMNSVDNADQYRSYYATQLNSFRMWIPIIYWLLATTIINASLYHQNVCARAGWEAHAHRAFRRELSWSLITARPKKPTIAPGALHLPIFHARRLLCELCWCRGEKRHTTVVCGACNMPLWLSSRRNCFTEKYTCDGASLKEGQPSRARLNSESHMAA